MSAVNKPYFVGLDFLRFFAAVFVFIFHLQLHFWGDLSVKITLNDNLGRLGVSFFFVLSGFLLTFLLLVEERDKGRISIPKFFVRRALRIWPLYFLALIFAFWVYPFLLKHATGYVYDERASVWRYFLFLGNFDVAYFNGPSNKMLGVHWSLAVEEQFYLVLPFLYLLFRKNVRLFLLVALLILSFSLWYKFNVFYYYDSLSVMYSLFAGILLGLVSFHFRELATKIFSNKLLMTVVSLVSVIYFVVLQVNSGILYKFRFLYYSGFVLETVFFAGLLFNFAFNSKVSAIFQKSKIAAFIAGWGKKYTYSLYLTHPIAITFSILICQHFLKINSFIFFVLVSTVLVAIICWLCDKLIEQKAEQLKKRFY